MTNEERKAKIKWLMRYIKCKEFIQALKDSEEKWRESATSTTTKPTYFKHISDKAEKDKMTQDQRRRNAMAPVVVHGGSGLSLGDKVAEIDALQREIDLAEQRAAKLMADIIRAIDALDDEREKTVLLKKYVDGMYLEEICVKMGYSYRQTKRIHNKAIEKIKMSPNVP